MMMELGLISYRRESSRLRKKDRSTLAVITSFLMFATGVAHAQNLTDTQIALVSADLADAAQLRWVP